MRRPGRCLGWLLVYALLTAGAAADQMPPAPPAVPRTPVETAPAPPPPGGPSLLDRFLTLERHLRTADTAEIVRYQTRLRDAGHYSGPVDGKPSRAVLRALGACLQAGCRLPR